MWKAVWLAVVTGVHVVLEPSTAQYFHTNVSPLHKAFDHFEELVKDGCSIEVLPDTIDWCDGKLSKNHKLPDNTVCQSIYADSLYLVCKNGRWISPKKGRERRAISEAYKAEKNQTCTRFCKPETDFFGKSAPFYGYCPVSVTLYPEGNAWGNETEVFRTWDTPEAVDQDGSITSLKQIVGQEPNTTFESSPSPGTNHIVSYLATDDDNMNWTCSFTITAEVPNCPPITELANGDLNCTNFNFRYSTCTFTCNNGYSLNGSQTTVCQENGTWSSGDDEPQCIVAACEQPIFVNNTDLEVVCDTGDADNSSLVSNNTFGSICWFQCPSTYLIRNDVLQEAILQHLKNLLDIAISEHSVATQEASDAEDYAKAARQEADKLEEEAVTAENIMVALKIRLQNETDVLDDLERQLNDTLELLAQKQHEYESTLAHGGEDLNSMFEEIQNLSTEVSRLNESLHAQQDTVNDLSSDLDSASQTAATARQKANEALMNATIAETVAEDKKDYTTQTQDAQTEANLNYYQAYVYSTTTTNMVVSSYAICTADGVWEIPGNPNCTDIEPPGIKCLPVVTHVLSSGSNSSMVTWSKPEAYDNSGSVTVYNISGPSPNDTLAPGQYIVQYKAVDDEGNLSPVCSVTINVQVYTCDDISLYIDVNTTAKCHSFELGSTCNVTSSLNGQSSVTCKQNATTGEMYWDFGVKQMCSNPSDPSNGVVSCDEFSGNLTCNFSCHEGYMLPYKSASVYTCSAGNVWNSDVPTRCIDVGDQLTANSSFILRYQTQNCNTTDLNSFIDGWKTILLKELPTYPACTVGYLCNVTTVEGECSDINKQTSFRFTIAITCEGPPSNEPHDKCDLNKQGDLFSSINKSVMVDGVLNSTGVNLTSNWLEAEQLTTPSCPAGAVMIGAYCVGCAAGSFLYSIKDGCIKCPSGTYAETDSLAECYECPSGTTTYGTGATECVGLQCQTPAYPTNGFVICDGDDTVYDNSTDNITTTDTGITCSFYCNDSYVLPYKTEYKYTCNAEGVWDSNKFPSRCIGALERRNTTYKFILRYQSQNCSEDLNDFRDKWEDFLLDVTPTYPECMTDYICEISVMMPSCNTTNNVVEVEFNIYVTCDGPPTSLPREASCNLTVTAGGELLQSVQSSVNSSALLAASGIDWLKNNSWLSEVSVINPTTCPQGAVLVGHYCVRCAAGTFLSGDQCYGCGIGAYSDTDGRTFCTTCAPGTSTYSTNSTECTETCPPGSYSLTGFVPCAICKTGAYQSNYTGKNCTACPADTWTTGIGSNSSEACVEYDLYFDADTDDIPLITVGEKMSVVFWMKYYYNTNVTLGLFNDFDEQVFQLVAAENPQILEEWDSTVLKGSIDLGTWSMFGLTYDASSDRQNVVVYVNGEEVFSLNLTEGGSTLKFFAGNTSLLTGLSISNTTADASEMSALYEHCGGQLSGAVFTQDDLAEKRLPAMKYAASTCKVPNDTVEANHCGIHRCQNGGQCENSTVGYTCNCTEQYGGPFCEETLVHGNWSEWYNATGCSATCGSGTQLRYRFCNNPPRSEYGNDCEGNSTETVDCFLQSCTACDPPINEGNAICDLEADHCTATCPRGYVMPRGQQQQSYQCGETTNYNWAPLHRLPICAVSRQPQSYSANLNVSFSEPVPCDAVSDVITQLKAVALSQGCPEDIDGCDVHLEIKDCEDGSRRRRGTTITYLFLVYTAPLRSNVTFDLVDYYSTGNMTDSIYEAINAIYVLEQMIEEIQSDPLQFVAVAGGVNYTVLSDDWIVTTTTNCDVGEVPVEGVCAQCQRGTRLVNGWCVYCDRGSYQTDTGQTSCISCPDGQNTEFIGARSPIECIALPAEGDITLIIIGVVVAVLALILIVLLVMVVRRFYRSAKEREKYDMEAERLSLYTDFPDIAYNVYFKRREVLGFDESGYPIIGKTRFMNGPVTRPQKDSNKHKEDSVKVPLYQDEQQLPFEYDPYAMWADEKFISPYEYPKEDTFDFPKIENAVRYRVPGRKHFQNTYPLSQFGYEDDPHIRSRKNLPLPVNIPVPKKLPQLMYRKPDAMSLSDMLKSQFGFRKFRNEDLEEGIPIDLKKVQENGVPPLSLKKKVTKNAKPKARKLSAPGSALVQSTRSAGSARSPRKSPRSAPMAKAGIVLKTKIEDRSPRAASATAYSPRSVSIDSTSPRRPATTLGRSPRQDDIDEDVPHPKPSRYVVPKDGPLPNNLPFPIKSALKVTHFEESSPRPETAMTTGRKSVTIREDANMTRPSTAATSFRPSTAGTSPREQEHKRPWSDARSARETVVAPYAARPKSSISTASDRPYPLPPEITEAYRPTSSIFRPYTPVEHPRPVIHGEVTVKRTAEGHSMFFPPTRISFEHSPPVEHTLRQMAPPPFLNRITPERSSRRGSNAKRVRLDLEDDNDEMSGNGSFFLTQVPEELSASRASLAGSIMSRGSKSSKKPSPPPDYSASALDKIIESSSMSHFEE